MLDPTKSWNDIDPEACWACRFDIADRRLQHVGWYCSNAQHYHSARLAHRPRQGAVAMKAMPALTNETFTPYCSVMRVFSIEFFLV
jgi:hypothetical protein